MLLVVLDTNQVNTHHNFRDHFPPFLLSHVCECACCPPTFAEALRVWAGVNDGAATAAERVPQVSDALIHLNDRGGGVVIESHPEDILSQLCRFQVVKAKMDDEHIRKARCSIVERIWTFFYFFFELNSAFGPSRTVKRMCQVWSVQQLVWSLQQQLSQRVCEQTSVRSALDASCFLFIAMQEWFWFVSSMWENICP